MQEVQPVNHAAPNFPAEGARRLARRRDEQFALVGFAGGCNNRCAFCCAAGQPPSPAWRTLQIGLGDGQLGPLPRLVIAGAEPTIQPGFERLVEAAHQAGHHGFQLWSNGRRFAYPQYAKWIVDVGLDETVILMPAGESGLYGLATGEPAGFEQAWRGIENLKTASQGRIRIFLALPDWEELESQVEAIAALAQRHALAGLILAPGRLPDKPIAPALRPGPTESELEFIDLRDNVPSLPENGPGISVAEPLEGPRLQLPAASYAVMSVGQPPIPFPHEAVIYLTYRCNCRCLFCPVDTQRPDPASGDIRVLIDDAADRGFMRICFNGGEPTMVAELVDFVRYAKQRGIAEVVLQSNCILLSEGDLPNQLGTAGLDLVMASLLGDNAELVDRLMDRPGAFEQVIRGIERLRAAGVPIMVHHLVNTRNLESVIRFPAFVLERFGPVPIAFSSVVDFDERPLTAGIVPPYELVAFHLRAAFQECERLEIPYGVLDCFNGLAPCALPDHVQRFGCVLAPSDQRELICADQFVKPDFCAQCDLCACCPGIRIGYTRLYGLSGLAPIRTSAGSADSSAD